jgi:diguanylate cyclase (GGDEF)-like protein
MRLYSLTNQSNISFEFASLDYHAPKNNQFAYFMDGIDNHWTYSGTRNFAIYTNLKPGRYTFSYKSSTDNGIWPDDFNSLKIIIKSPPWQRWWAYLLYSIIGAVIIYIAFELNVKRALERKVRELRATRSELELANNKLKDMIIRDGLTNLYNRRFLDTTLERLWLHSIRSGSPLSMIIIDIDYFKAYNDHYGHQAGDRVLVNISKTFNDSIKRRNDFVARYGGEEFCIVLPTTDIDGAELVCENCTQNVAALNIPHEQSLVSNKLTISMGYASIIPKAEDKIKDFFKRVDDALYEAKRQGRNRYFKAE